jgi:Cof subfamily protein (haloacid dehalogenase superfamily)
MDQQPTTYPHPIKLVALDIDGTLLNSKLELSERTERVLKAAIAEGVQVVLATGKTRNAGVKLTETLGLNAPGIYMQGVLIYDTDGKIMYQQALDPAIARQVITFAEDRGFQIIAYSGTRILVRKNTPEMNDAIVKYHEPAPETVGALQNVLDSLPINKLMAVGDPRGITALRWHLGTQLGGSCRLMQAGLSNMLEILPPGASKGAALKVLLKSLQIPGENAMAMGDAENDIETLKNVGLGVAVGNADPRLKEVAKFVVGTNDEDGVAEAIERFVLKRKLDAPKAAEPEKMIDVPAAPADAKPEAKPESKPEAQAVTKREGGE